MFIFSIIFKDTLVDEEILNNKRDETHNLILIYNYSL